MRSLLSATACLALLATSHTTALPGPGPGPPPPPPPHAPGGGGPPPSECPLEHAPPAGAVTSAWEELRRIHTEQLPGPSGASIAQRRLRTLIDAYTDVDFFVRAVLRGMWQQGSPRQRQRWRLTLEHVLRTRYLKGMDAPGRHRIAVQRSLVSCDQASVRVAITDVDRQTERVVDLDMIYRAPKWRVFDVSLDGVSLVETWRSRFRRIYRDGGIAAVDEQLQLVARRYGLAQPLPPPPPDGDAVESEQGDPSD